MCSAPLCRFAFCEAAGAGRLAGYHWSGAICYRGCEGSSTEFVLHDPGKAERYPRDLSQGIA
mgnify:CR=1 FL=1